MVNTRYPNEVIVAKLSDRYGDVALAKMIAAAAKFDGTEKLATDLRAAQFLHWKSQGATPKEIGGMLQATVNSNDALKKVLVDYETFYGKTKVTSGYDPTWVTTDKSVDEVYKILRLDEAGDKLFDSPDLIRWASFVYKVVNKKDAGYLMFTKLIDQHGDVALAKMIASATKVDSTEKLATGLRTELFRVWWLRGASPKEIDSLLQVTANSDDAIKKVSVDYEKFYGKTKLRANMEALLRGQP
ncbi:hypothetical protein PR003_g27722 [Phytophthora rubi]|uniref:RxLR effector PexRD54 WY domain-containing protein n=1 Tax=Phytophthora rubi TaxID=129364 RepID=A0A6A4BVZ2_9STRA|nr:hypothetical protein PR002_g25847 [Phytophthora rubi]KAE9281274.1 hypothetical protein PR003_g27722 [Phytophthora rubi]